MRPHRRHSTPDIEEGAINLVGLAINQNCADLWWLETQSAKIRIDIRLNEAAIQLDDGNRLLGAVELSGEVVQPGHFQRRKRARHCGRIGRVDFNPMGPGCGTGVQPRTASIWGISPSGNVMHPVRCRSCVLDSSLLKGTPNARHRSLIFPFNSMVRVARCRSWFRADILSRSCELPLCRADRLRARRCIHRAAWELRKE